MIEIENLKPFQKFCYTIGMIPTSYKESLTYEEQLIWFCDFLQNTVIPTVNNNGQAVTELQNLYIELKNYVDNYFENLDVQEEINQKLDDMAESGELEEIISSYLNTKSLLVFNSVAEMINSETLQNGSFTKTLGYYAKNDGGGATYKIRTITGNDTVDNASIISLNRDDLIAELILENEINVKQFGCYGDSTHDDTQNLQKAINFAYSLENAKNYNSYKILIPKGKYKITSELRLISSTLTSSEYSNIQIEGMGQGSSVLISEFEDDGNVLYLNASSKFTLKDISFKNISGNDVNITAVKIDGASMNIDITNVFTYNFYVGFNTYVCVGNLTNCFANNCNCGFLTNGTSTNLINCYASQCSKKDEVNAYEGCGYYLNSVYSLLEACASDTNFIAYKIIKNGITLLNCGMEGDTNGIIIETPNSNIYQAPIVIDGYTYNSVTKPTIKIEKAQKVIIKNHNFSLDYDYVQIASNLPNNVVEYSNCNFYVANENLYNPTSLIPLNNVARTNGLIYNFDGYRNEGKGRIYARTIKWRVSKTDTTKLRNGRQTAVMLKIFTIIQWTDQRTNSLNEEFLINFYVSGTYLAKSNAKYDNTKLTLTRTDDDNYYYYELTPYDTTVVPENNKLCFDITVIDSIPSDLNTNLNLVEFEGLDY